MPPSKNSLAGFVLACVTLVCACHSDAKPNGASAAPPPPKVLFTRVVRKDLPMYLEAVATVDGYVNAEIRARVKGYLKAQEYKEGGLVKTNQLLFTIERAEYETAVASARANLARAVAASQRNNALAERSRKLFTTGAASQQDLDNTQAASADAEAQIAGARAQLTQAQLNLSYTQVRSPIDGVAGLATVRVGNLVGQDGPTLLTTVSQIDPMRVSFPISEADYVANPEQFKELSKRDLPWAKQQFNKLEHGDVAEHGDPGIELVLSDGSVFPHRGIIVTAGRQFDPGTGTIQLQALVPNPEGLLRPNQYGRIRLRRQGEGKDSLAVPDKALVVVQGTYSLGVLGSDDVVHMQRVEVGPSVNGVRLIQKGVAEGDRIVVEGVQKITDGSKVRAEPAPQATASTTVPTTTPSSYVRN